MAETTTIRVNGQEVTVAEGSVVFAAIAAAGQGACRTSVDSEARGALCGMGICYECRVTIDGRPHCRSCQVICKAGMEVRTDES